jgi:hypothetical protein
MKGDASGDGRTLNNDIPGFTAARTRSTTLTQLQHETFLHDFSGDRRILNNDIPGFVAARADSVVCP